MKDRKPRSTDIELDGAGIIYPYVANRKWNNVYRIEAHLTTPVDPQVLAAAAEQLRCDYPYFFRTLGVSKRRYVLRECEPGIHPDIVYSKTIDICKPFDLKSGAPLVRFMYRGNALIVEMFHCLTDGHGAAEFMKALLRRYRRAALPLTRSGKAAEADEMLLKNTEDSFEELYQKGGKSVSRLMTSAYQLGRRLPVPTGFRVLDIPCAKLLSAAHSYGVTAAVLLCAMQIKAIADSRDNIRCKIRISVPVDLRRVFPLSSCRNSSLYFLVSVKAKETADFLQLLQIVKKQFESELTADKLQNAAYTNVSNAKLKVFDLLPLPLKKFVLNIGYTRFGENQFTATMTDIGVIRLEDELRPMVNDIFFVLGRQKTKPVNIAASTYGNSAKLVVTYDIECNDFIGALQRLTDDFIM